MSLVDKALKSSGLKIVFREENKLWKTTTFRLSGNVLVQTCFLYIALHLEQTALILNAFISIPRMPLTVGKLSGNVFPTLVINSDSVKSPIITNIIRRNLSNSVVATPEILKHFCHNKMKNILLQ